MLPNQILKIEVVVRSGWINYNNFNVVSVKLLECILSRQLSHTSLLDVLNSLKRVFNLSFVHKVVYNIMGFYMSLKDIPLEMVCGICGINPLLLCFDATRKVSFRIPPSYKAEKERPADKPDRPSCSYCK